MKKRKLKEGHGGRGNAGATGSTPLDMQHVFNPDAYWDPKKAAKDFIELNKEADVNKMTDIQTVKSYLRNVYKGGDHAVPLKKFVRALVKAGVKVKDRRENRLSDMEVVGENKMKLRNILREAKSKGKVIVKAQGNKIVFTITGVDDVKDTYDMIKEWMMMNGIIVSSTKISKLKGNKFTIQYDPDSDWEETASSEDDENMSPQEFAKELQSDIKRDRVIEDY